MFARLGRVPAVLTVAVVATLVTACGGGSPSASAGSPTQPASSGAVNTTTTPIALVGGTLVDGTGKPAIPNATVLLKDGRIVAAGPAAQTQVPAAYQTIDVTGATILPGFINAHVHQGFNKANLQAWAEGGVTTIRDESALPEQIDTLKSLQTEIRKDPHYARLVSAGSMLKAPGGYGQRAVSTVEEARQAVLDEIDKGVDAIKIAMEDGYGGVSGLPKLTAEQVKAIVDTAHAHGLPVSGHITQSYYLQPMLQAGADDIAHLPYNGIEQAAVDELVARDVYVTPTYTVYANSGVGYSMADNIALVVKAGGHIALGNDYAGGPGTFELGIPMREIEVMAEAGMTPMQIIQAATANAAHVLRLDKEIGTIEPGKAADILVVGGDPLANLQALRSIRLVVHAGSIIRNELAK